MSVLIFVFVMYLNIAHLRARKMPIKFLGTVIAVVLLITGAIYPLFQLAVGLVVSIIIECVYGSMSDNQKEKVAESSGKEIKESEQKIQRAQESYEKLFCLDTFTVEQEFSYRRSLKILEDNNVWYYVRNGLITSILVRQEDANIASELLAVPNAEKH